MGIQKEEEQERTNQKKSERNTKDSRKKKRRQHVQWNCQCGPLFQHAQTFLLCGAYRLSLATRPFAISSLLQVVFFFHQSGDESGVIGSNMIKRTKREKRKYEEFRTGTTHFFVPGWYEPVHGQRLDLRAAFFWEELSMDQLECPSDLSCHS